MSRYYRHNPDEPISHDWLAGAAYSSSDLDQLQAQEPLFPLISADDQSNGKAEVLDGETYWMGTHVSRCPMCGIAPTNVDDCGCFGDPDCPCFGIGRAKYDRICADLPLTDTDLADDARSMGNSAQELEEDGQE